jgi:hypothetical protein
LLFQQLTLSIFRGPPRQYSSAPFSSSSGRPIDAPAEKHFQERGAEEVADGM